MSERRVVVDTNVLISAALSPSGTARRTLVRAAREGTLLASADTAAEFVEKLNASKFERYMTAEDREAFALWILARTERVAVSETVQVCRDPGDDKFLELALSGRADVLVSGDRDVLVLDPFRGIPVVTPAAFLEFEWPA